MGPTDSGSARRVVVVGRPRTEEGALRGLPALISLAAARQGARVELVGSVPDDAAGDRTVVELGRAGIGHAALLRDPTADAGPARLDASDLELGLRYVHDAAVVVLAEPLAPDVVRVAAEAASYSGATLVAIAGPDDRETPSRLLDGALVLRPPPSEPAGSAELLGRLVARIAGGEAANDAFRDLLASSGWERSS